MAEGKNSLLSLPVDLGLKEPGCARRRRVSGAQREAKLKRSNSKKDDFDEPTEVRISPTHELLRIEQDEAGDAISSEQFMKLVRTATRVEEPERGTVGTWRSSETRGRDFSCTRCCMEDLAQLWAMGKGVSHGHGYCDCASVSLLYQLLCTLTIDRHSCTMS
eukprot:g24317.t1